MDLERLLVTTARVAPDDERLFVVAASWLAAHHAFVNGRRLAGLASAVAPRAPEADIEVSAVLGALLSWASELAGGAEALDVAAARCQPLREARPLFRVVALLPSLAAAAEREACPVFARWGLWHNDQTPKPAAVRPVDWLLAHALFDAYYKEAPPEVTARNREYWMPLYVAVERFPEFITTRSFGSTRRSFDPDSVSQDRG